MKDRIFSFNNEDDVTFVSEKSYIVVPSEKISKIYNLSGYYKINPDYDANLYDPEDEDTHPYIEWGEEWSDGGEEIYEKDDDGEFYLVELEDLYHEDEVEEYWDGSNWKKVTLTSENGWCNYIEETDEFEEGYFDLLYLFFERERGTGHKTRWYTDKKGRYWQETISYWQGSYRDSFKELTEEELLVKCLPHWNPDEYDKQFLPLIKNMVRHEAVCINAGYECPDYEIIDISEKKHVKTSQSDDNISGWDIYELPDGRHVKFSWSRWQGSTDHWELAEK